MIVARGLQINDLHHTLLSSWALQPRLSATGVDVRRWLQELYTAPDFVRVPSFVDGETPTTLNDVACHLTYQRQVKKQSEGGPEKEGL